MNALYICSKNKWRSPTAETIFADHEEVNVKSAGTQRSAVVSISAKLINWADIILVMEQKHKKHIVKQYRSQLDLPKIIVLEMPDEYQYMDPELIELLKDSLSAYLEICSIPFP